MSEECRWDWGLKWAHQRGKLTRPTSAFLSMRTPTERMVILILTPELPIDSPYSFLPLNCRLEAVNRIRRMLEGEGTQNRKVVIKDSHEAWCTLDCTIANKVRFPSRATKEGNIEGHTRRIVYCSLQREWHALGAPHCCYPRNRRLLKSKFPVGSPALRGRRQLRLFSTVFA